MTTLCDASLIAHAKSGDHAAVTQIYEIYGPMLFRFILSRVSDPDVAEDLRAEVFVRMLEGLPNYEDRGWPFSAWLYRIAYARTVDVLRQSRRRHSVSLDERQLGALEPPDDAVMSRMAYHEIKGAMDILTREQQLVLRLRFDEDRSLAEIAQSLGRTVGSVKALQHRGLTRLAQELGSHAALVPAV